MSSSTKAFDPAREFERLGYVYFVRVGKFTKIGCSTEPTKRIHSLASGFPEPHEVIAVLRTICNMTFVERAFHDQFAAKRRHREWFELDEDDIRLIQRFGDVF